MARRHVRASLPRWARQARGHWEYVGESRPPFAVEPGPGQESVWDYPRPPRLEPDTRLVEVWCGELRIARTQRALRLLETASPPTFYLCPADVRQDLLASVSGSSVCEWKGHARFFDVEAGDRRIERAAWSYREPFPPFEKLAGWISFYPALLDCRVDGERVIPQAGGFYGGWVTSEIVGPMKGEPGTGGW
jgi:uncharacterized protein (DUF427 family)